MRTETLMSTHWLTSSDALRTPRPLGLPVNPIMFMRLLAAAEPPPAYILPVLHETLKQEEEEVVNLAATLSPAGQIIHTRDLYFASTALLTPHCNTCFLVQLGGAC